MDGLNETLEDAPLAEEFQVDDLLDLRELPEPEKEEEEEDDDDEVAKKVVFVAFENKETLHLLGISLPEETDAANLEWLSGFVHDCDSEHHPAEKQPSPAAVRRLKNEIFVPVKAKRSERHRRAGKFWSVSTNSSVSSTSSPSPSSSSSSSYLTQESYRKKLAGERKCSHCGVQKTPQWRAGPNGPKTLCNACGVRFKSGRLLPEYRPACSPTFVSNLHSNKHRKVLEMRRKEAAPPVQTNSG